MSEINDGGPALPVNELDQRTGGIFAQHMGMSLRDWFAGQALAGMVPDTARNKAEAAYAIADEMLSVRSLSSAAPMEGERS